MSLHASATVDLDNFVSSTARSKFNEELKKKKFTKHCSGLMKPDTHLGENTRQIEVSDDQATSFLFS
jgi:hypothetical protein